MSSRTAPAPAPGRVPHTVTAADVDAAAERLAGLATVTPLHRSTRLSALCDAGVWLEREDVQPVRS